MHFYATNITINMFDTKVLILTIALIITFANADVYQEFLDTHNSLRAKHGSPPLVLNEKVSNMCK